LRNYNIINQIKKMLRLATLAALFSTAQAADGYVPYKEGDLMADYSKDYRALDCTECI
jgi:hypothetical protein|tara:strand:+ start:87 stop:260 length:174 start_codon:yes stop_codon:yes gene_type:complete